MAKGSIKDIIPLLEKGIKHGFQDIGFKGIDILHKMLYQNKIMFELRSIQSQFEGKVHGLFSHEINAI